MKRMLAATLAAVMAAATARAQSTYTDGGLNVIVANKQSASTTLGSLNAAVTIKLQGRPGAGVFVSTANLDAVLSAELSMDEGTTWRATDFMAPDGSTSATITFSGAAATEQRAIVVLGGTTHVRARVSTYNSGTSSAVARVTAAGSFALRAPAAAAGGTSSNFGAAFPSAGTAAGFSDGTNMQGARAFDLDSGAGTQYGLGVNLRKVASGGSVEAGTSADPLRVDPTGTTAQPVTDNAGSLTVDAPVGTPVAVRPSDGSAFTTPFDLDADTSAGTANREAVMVAGTASGGPNPIGSSIGTNSAGDEIGLVVRPYSTSGVPGTATWTSATAVDTVLAVTGFPFSTTLVSLTRSGTVSSGQVNFECSIDSGATYYPIWVRADSMSPPAAAQTWNLASTIDALFTVNIGNCTTFRVRLNPVITGAGSIILRAVSSTALQPTTAVIANSLTIATGDLNSITSVGTVGSVTPGTGATDLGKAEDAAHASGHTGVVLWGVRQDAPTTFTSADDEYSPVALDAYGVPYSRQDHPNRIECTADNIGTTLTQLTNCGAPGAGLSLYITDVSVVSTTATGGSGQLRTGASGTANCGASVAAFYPPVSTSRTFGYPGNTASTGPFVLAWATPRKIAANSMLCVVCVVTNTCNVLVQGFIAP